MKRRLSTVSGVIAGLVSPGLLRFAVPSPAPAEEAAFPPPPDHVGSETCTGYHVGQFEKLFSHIASCAWLLDPVRVSIASTDLSTFSAVAEETTG